MKRALIFLLCAVLLCRTHAARAETYSLADDIFRRIHGVISSHADEIQTKTAEAWNEFLSSSSLKDFSCEISEQCEIGSLFSQMMTELEREIKQHLAVSFHSAAASMEKGSFSERLAGALFETIAEEMAKDIEDSREAGKNSPSGKKVPATPVFKPDKLIPQSE